MLVITYGKRDGFLSRCSCAYRVKGGLVFRLIHVVILSSPGRQSQDGHYSDHRRNVVTSFHWQGRLKSCHWHDEKCINKVRKHLEKIGGLKGHTKVVCNGLRVSYSVRRGKRVGHKYLVDVCQSRFMSFLSYPWDPFTENDIDRVLVFGTLGSW